MKTPRFQKAEVLRHDLLFRVAHWSIFVEGILLVLSGFQLGGILGGALLPISNATFHVLVGFAFIGTSGIYLLGITTGGDYKWVGLRRIPYSFRFILMETRGWFGFGPKPANPVFYDRERQEYAEKLIPSVIVVFWAFVLLGLILAVTGLALAFPQQLSSVYSITDFIGGTLTGVTGMAFMLTFHRLMTYLLVVLVMMHIYASFIFNLVGSMITGRRFEKVAAAGKGERGMLNATGGRGSEETSLKGKKVALCLGNRFMGDDGLGIMVADELEKLAPDALVESCRTVDLSLLFRYRGASKIVVVDALEAGKPPGTISKYRIAPREGPLNSLPGQHELGIHDLFDLASEAGALACPMTIIGVEPSVCRPGEGLSDEIRRVIPDVIGAALGELGLASNAGRHTPPSLR